MFIDLFLRAELAFATTLLRLLKKPLQKILGTSLCYSLQLGSATRFYAETTLARHR